MEARQIFKRGPLLGNEEPVDVGVASKLLTASIIFISRCTGGPRLVPYLGSQQTALLGKPH